MALNGKVLVIGSVLKLERPFKAATITQMTSLSRQLVWQHLIDLTELGYLEKIDKTYVVKDKEGLLSSLLEAADSVESGLPKPGGIFTKEVISTTNVKLETIVAARSLNLPMAASARSGYLQKIDDSITVLKQMRKYLTTSQKTVGSAQKFFKKQGGEKPEVVEWVWKTFAELSGGDITVDLPEFESALREALLKEDDE